MIVDLSLPIFDNIESEFGDLLARLNEHPISRGERAVIWLGGTIVAVAAALSAGFAVAKTLI